MGKGKKNPAPDNGGFEELLRQTAELQELEFAASQLMTGRDTLLERLKQVNGKLVVSCIRIRERAEELEREHNKLLTAVNTMDDEVWFCDAQGRISMLNQAAARCFGSKRRPDARQGPIILECLDGLEVYNVDGRPRPQEDAPLLRSLAGETLRGIEEIIRHPRTGRMRHRIVNSSPVVNSAGEIVGAVAVVRDIGESMVKSSDAGVT
ncbi:MAG: PAS domain-containing protein [Chloroflexi bacterium]|nr:PAS domain-containing protein [Chloroflexota bacterium]